MAKSAHADLADAYLNELAKANLMIVCSAQPTTRAEAVTTYALADVAMTPGNGNGDFTIANGDISGRKLTMTQKANVDIDTTGTATHIALVDGTRLLLVTTCTSEALNSAFTVTIPAWKVEVGSPT